jgi:hypothetical protein
MMEKLAQPGECGVCTSNPFHFMHHHAHTKLWCMLQLRGKAHSPHFYSTPLPHCALDFVSPICLPFPELTAAPADLEGSMLEVAGWGAVDIYAKR